MQPFVHPAPYREAVYQTASSGACRTISIILWLATSITWHGALSSTPSASWGLGMCDLKEIEETESNSWHSSGEQSSISQLWRRQMLPVRGLRQYENIIKPQDNVIFLEPHKLPCSPATAAFVMGKCWSTLVPANASSKLDWLADAVIEKGLAGTG